jgi:hypothetical protein
MESLPSHLDSIAREIASHQKAIATRDQNDPDDFAIELGRDVSSEEAVTFTDRGRAGAHLRQLCFVVARESRSTGRITRLVGRYRGFEIIARQRGRQLDALSSLFSETDLFLRAGEGEPGYGVNLGESDAGILQSMDAQLRGLEGKLEKSLAAQAELEHRQQQITAELNKGFEPAARYEELRLRLSALNRELTNAGVEIEASPELSNLDEEAFRPVESGVSVHQILSLTEQSVETGEAQAVAFNDQTPIASDASVIESECVIAVAADVRSARSDNGADRACTRADVEGESNNGFFVLPEGDHARTATTANRRAASKSATARGASQQMRFNWS